MGHSHFTAVVLVGSLVLAMTACGGKNDLTGPGATGLSGNWNGNDNYGTLHMTLSQSGTSLTGTWSTSSGTSGTLNGSVDAKGVSVNATLTPSVPNRCPSSVTATIEGQNVMRGTWVATNCTQFSSSPFTVNRQ